MSAVHGPDTGASPWADAARPVALLQRLRHTEDVRELLAVAADEAVRELPFTRVVLLTVAEGRLTADDTGALADPGSDRLRRHVLAEPVDLLAGSLEAALVGRRRPDGDLEGRPSVLGARLGLGELVLATVAPAGAPLALLVCDRPDAAVTPAEQRAAEGFAAVVGVALEQAVLRRRMDDVVHELRHLMASADALMGELQRAPVALPSVAGARVVFPLEGLLPTPREGGPASLLTEREVEILDLLVAGRSNRDIATQLVLAPDTIKGHVARILRKLGASNRVEAVSRYLALTRAAP